MSYTRKARRLRLTASTSDRYDISSFQYTSEPHARGLLGRSTGPPVSVKFDFGPGSTLSRKTIPEHYLRQEIEHPPPSTPSENQSLYRYFKAASTVCGTPIQSDWSAEEAIEPLKALAHAIAGIYPACGGCLLDSDSAFEFVHSDLLSRRAVLVSIWYVYHEIQQLLQVGERTSVDVEIRHVWELLRSLEHVLYLHLGEQEASYHRELLTPDHSIFDFMDCALEQIEELNARRIRVLGLAMSLFETGFYRQF